MSVDIRDFRRSREDKRDDKPAHIPLEQAATAPENLTGDDRLDKLIRVIEKKIAEIEPVCSSIAVQCMAVIEDKELKKGQLMYAHQRGLMDAYRDVLSIPAQILVEENIRS
jgi:hypothetical protein